jgi:hypothetical protein
MIIDLAGTLGTPSASMVNAACLIQELNTVVDNET